MPWNPVSTCLMTYSCSEQCCGWSMRLPLLRYSSMLSALTPLYGAPPVGEAQNRRGYQQLQPSEGYNSPVTHIQPARAESLLFWMSEIGCSDICQHILCPCTRLDTEGMSPLTIIIITNRPYHQLVCRLHSVLWLPGWRMISVKCNPSLPQSSFKSTANLPSVMISHSSIPNDHLDQQYQREHAELLNFHVLSVMPFRDGMLVQVDCTWKVQGNSCTHNQTLRLEIR